MIRLKGIRVDVNNNLPIIDIITSKLKIDKTMIIDYKIHKKSIDARSKMLFSYVYDFDVELTNEDYFFHHSKLKNISKVENEEYKIPKMGDVKLNTRPIIIGSGPAGLFAAYHLAMSGFKPIIFERGEIVEKRVKSIENYWNNGILNENSNVQFGEGGAGTFSDGKLNTLVKDKNYRMKQVFKVFVECGAPKEILYDSKPHIGTDILRKVIVNMRNKIIDMGGDIYYDSLMQDIIIKDNKVTGIVVNNIIYEADVLILAIGHSARDTYERLYKLGINLEAKPLAIGIRIMHPQDLINEAQYPINYPNLPKASYKLTYQASDKRGVYSFCMCPGGYVVNSSSKEGFIVTNGMSNYKRDSGFANSAIIVNISPNDYGTSPLDGLHFLETIESKAYKLGNGKLIVQSFEDYKKNIIGELNRNNIAIKGLYQSGNINEIFPEYINKDLKEGIKYFGTKIKGFDAGDVILVAPETRTSSPVRIIRDKYLQTNIKGIYPCGEGSGYAGGITTSAIDGIKVFEEIIKKYST